MSMQLTARVSALEAEVRQLREAVTGLLSVIVEPAPKVNGNGPRAMCPKCGEKPNYHLHVVNCKGPSKQPRVG